MRIIKGTEKSDDLKGTSQADTIYAYGGNDNIVLTEGGDFVYGGNGSDNFLGSSSFLSVSKQTTFLYGENGDDYFLFTPTNQTQLNNFLGINISGGSGFDILQLDLTSYKDVSHIKIDSLFDKSKNVDYFRLDGNNYNNVYEGSSKSNQVDIFAGGGDDTFIGKSKNDSYINLGGKDVIYGNEGNDSLSVSGKSYKNLVFGGSGSDTITVDNDLFHVVNSDGGDDFVSFTSAGINSKSDGGLGFDLLELNFQSDKKGINFDASVPGSSKNPYLKNHVNYEMYSLTGGSGSDTLIGGANSDYFASYNGGNDVLIGEAGNDYFDVSLKSNLISLSGGSGLDEYYISAVQPAQGFAKIYGYQANESISLAINKDSKVSYVKGSSIGGSSSGLYTGIYVDKSLAIVLPDYVGNVSLVTSVSPEKM